ncbi:hypothetical protein Q3G72_033107 [Acer saccharum]|nr:hypothetical protein Q3G72_033107 [Acer saccharum]
MAINVPLPMHVHPFQVPAPLVCFQTWLLLNVVVNVCGDDAQISVCSPRKPGLLSTIFYILEKYNLDVVSAHVTSDSYRRMYMIQAHDDENNFTKRNLGNEVFDQRKFNFSQKVKKINYGEKNGIRRELGLNFCFRRNYIEEEENGELDVDYSVVGDRASILKRLEKCSQGRS